ncbi:MAG TPA: UDP-N-acetylglucosamine--N-acetylmuramyl-(pentapeptide) pyrophosphoryl-undecaprenol N-acetylglucosamine transferase [Patescibacteria group bacterium]|jgi:UDP-N-acetylglucosamine--N-acetylmuramyl-(pentapeptide) pyrophosphoryl-undecaprenol N-acetylglucosamine transferase|nr:UDP-N-acetylglucosamine--N-acetylmuramyl-(pentapeptide) pyrophosphoryl-undecaprenol N-acetylglucosamine transferase [Patescibacteria group bacterium]
MNMQQNKEVKILLAGGGTGGSVTPLLAVADEIKKVKPKTHFLFVGTKKGPEKILVQESGMEFTTIPSAKFRRYFSLQNILDVFIFLVSLVRSFLLVRKFKPDVIFSAGGFVAVPVSWAGKLLGSKIVIHQQDARIGLANKLIAPFADKITTAFEYTAKNFYSGSGLFMKSWNPPAEWIGNPVRKEFFDASAPNKDFFRLNDRLPVLLVIGGATGSEQINQVVELALPELLKSHQVIHVTGRDKNVALSEDPNYHPYKFLDKEIFSAFKLAHLVLARAGLSTLAELSALGKIAIIVPMPNSHQEDNAIILKNTGSAVVLSEQEFTPEDLVRVIVSLKFNPARQQTLSKNIQQLFPREASVKLAKIIIKTINGTTSS